MNRQLTYVALAAGLVTLATLPVMAGEATTQTHVGKRLSYVNTTNRSARLLNGTQASNMASLELNLKKPAKILVQFTSELAVEEADGCPCSVRTSLQVNGAEPITLKRINLGSPAIQSVDKYEHDRQNVDGSYVLDLPKGKHMVSLIYQQVTGEHKAIEVYYLNMQTIAF